MITGGFQGTRVACAAWFVLSSCAVTRPVPLDSDSSRGAPEGDRPGAIHVHRSLQPCFEASEWREADRLFRGDRHWIGADGASSVDLGDGRTLWLFSDTWIDGSGKGSRRGATMVSNTVAVQTGTNPAAATIRFYWGRGNDGAPAAIFPDRGDERHWIGSGVRVGDRLVIFLGRIRATNTGLGFEAVGWSAVMIENPDAEPPAWRVRPLHTPVNSSGIMVGFAASLRHGDHVHAFGAADPVEAHPIYVARWSADAVRRGALMEPEWWAGDRLGWVSEPSPAFRRPILQRGASELTIHRDSSTRRFLAVLTSGFGAADIVMMTAPAMTGPWSAPRLLYRPPEYHRPKAMIYSAKAHPQLAGADLVLTYSTNSFDFAEHFADSSMYYPRFVRMTRCE